jgi:hypothetical protein
MAKSYAVYGETWEHHNGKRVKIDGLVHELQVTVYRARYPLDETVISVYAEPVNKSSRYYEKIRAALRDDWSTDVLESAPELQAKILAQLGVPDECAADRCFCRPRMQFQEIGI